MLTLRASGSVSDYSDTSALQTSIADNAGVDPSAVSISVVAASVIITATIKVPASTTADALQATLTSRLGTAASASTALGITVESEPTIVARGALAIGDQEASVEGDKDDDTPKIVGGVIGGVVGVILLCLVAYFVTKCLNEGKDSACRPPKKEVLVHGGQLEMTSADNAEIALTVTKL